ncbi:MAG: orotidine-5'-phosphate decarboxylase [Gammaproteobacteria bacterium]|nr:orotidine-5'-phosphate decarboxylase [Gammaproteobacteria bacterium]
MTDSRVIVALDFSDETQAMKLVDQINPALCRLKIGKEMFTRSGPELVKRLVNRGYDVFLDLKYHDIPNTVANACKAAADLGVWMINVHALGGPAMLAAARSALSSPESPILIAVTILTSSSHEDLLAVGIDRTPAEMVQRLASIAKGEGINGVVCSARESHSLRSSLGSEFLLVTPGIRLSTDNADDQKRVVSPADAIRQGSDYLVIGRPITQAKDPVQKLLTINSEISQL